MSDWMEINLRIKPEAQEATTEILYNEGAQGVWLDEEGDRVVIKTYLPYESVTPEKLVMIKDKIQGLNQFGLDPGNVELFTDKVEEEDWANSWKEYFYPEKITETFVVKPTWREYQANPGEIVIEIDPGMAFGTGTHPSTYLAIQALEDFASKVHNMLDVGTGSGILAIAAALLGVPQITAVDIDRVAVKVAQENVLLNKVQKQVQVMRSDLVERIKEKGKKFKLVTANIIAEIILKLIPDLPEIIEDEGYFIASGIITERFLEVQKALKDKGFQIKRIYREGEWVALVAEKS
ncbi:ribosomal protein L11 methyltransferase [Anoxybacter fermentans]|uniref:Ribosomal protein L11 methyltransferase n=1 Tax=Anoxybacter fermentans TaxID=1323375 RepID=A0A3S9SY00_9FIRM|nr:50S ribosomal protein L11 methyltransferase [Anoxybacter fermentans]AZR73171.1 ribosomal protein L11 methyltransferase [Anoxybacter fermentans]